MANDRSDTALLRRKFLRLCASTGLAAVGMPALANTATATDTDTSVGSASDKAARKNRRDLWISKCGHDG